MSTVVSQNHSDALIDTNFYFAHSQTIQMHYNFFSTAVKMMNKKK